MGKSLYNDINQNTGNHNMSFPEFMKMMKGKDPNQILNEMVRSGRVNQQQLNAVQQIANQQMSMFDKFKSMFGF